MATRRFLLSGGAAGVAVAALGARFFSPPARAAQTYEVTHTEAEWRKILNPEQFEVLREEGTEQPFTSPLLNEHRKGIFSCAACKLDDFSSTTKFESGTGWPSFWAPITPKAIEVRTDRSFGMVRQAVNCSRCGSHLGHVFDDGPKPTGLRYCMNGVALTFRPTA